jgi:hypothetical protein
MNDTTHPADKHDGYQLTEREKLILRTPLDHYANLNRLGIKTGMSSEELLTLRLKLQLDTLR